jgi:hypothetical protein
VTTPLATLLALGHPSLEAVLLALAGELGATEDEAAELQAGIGVLADRLDDGLRDAAAQLDQLSERVADAFAVEDSSSLEALRPDTVLRDRRGDELTVAALVASAAQRRGWSVEVVLGDQRAVVAHRTLDAELVISPRYHGRIVEADDLHDGALAWESARGVADALVELADSRQVLFGPALN